MNRALVYLWFTLLLRKGVRFIRSLRRPLSLMGFLAVVSLLGFLFYFREHKIMGQLVRRENLLGGALVMLCGSIFKGFLQRGLACEPADVEFLFTSPFTQRQVMFYRLLPNYLYVIVQSLIFVLLFGSHFHHLVLTALCLTLFQIVCFHLAAMATILGGSISEQTHYRMRCMMLGFFFLIAALYLRLEWDFRIVPSFCLSPVFQLFFYPALTLPDAANAIQVHRWVLRLWVGGLSPVKDLWQNILYLGGFAAAAVSSLWLLFQVKVNIFEAALDTTTRVADKRNRLRNGLTSTRSTEQLARSVGLPRRAFFHGVGAIVWKNLIAARRSRRQMIAVSLFVFVYTGFFTALLWIYHDLGKKAGGVPLHEARGFTTGTALFLGMLAFFLQRMFPFDFRNDGPHLLNFRILPTSALALALAEIAVPTALCLVAQAFGVIPLIMFGRFDWPTLVLVLLGYPVVSLALNSVWNLHYLLAAAKRMRGRAESTSAVGMVVVVAFSFLVFYPAGWATIKIANHFADSQSIGWGFTLAAAGGLTVQSAVDVLLILALARCFQRFEVSPEG